MSIYITGARRVCIYVLVMDSILVLLRLTLVRVRVSLPNNQCENVRVYVYVTRRWLMSLSLSETQH